MILFFAIVLLIGLVRALWPPKEPEIRLPVGCNSLEEYIEACEMFDRLTEKQQLELMNFARRKR